MIHSSKQDGSAPQDRQTEGLLRYKSFLGAFSKVDHQSWSDILDCLRLKMQVLKPQSSPASSLRRKRYKR
jgi:hypothetical protein